MCQLTYRPTSTVELDVSALPSAVQLIVASRTGRLAPGHLAHLEETEDFSRTVHTIGEDQLSPLLEFAWTGHVDMTFPRLSHAIAGHTDELPPPPFAVPTFATDTPFAQSRLGCTWFTTWRSGLEDVPVVVVCGDSAPDFCYAFTRQRVVGHTYWLPLKPGDASSGLGKVLRETITRVLDRYSVSPSGNRQVLLSSLTLGMAELQALLSELSVTMWGRHFNSSMPGSLSIRTVDPDELSVRRDQVLLDRVHFSDSLYEPFVEAQLARNVEIPYPTDAEGLQADSLRWQVDIEIPDHVLPARWALRSRLVAGDELSHWAVRSSTTGVSVDSHGRGFSLVGSPLSQLLVHVRLRYPPAEEVFATLLAGANITLEESDKGLYTRRMLELWGGLQPMADALRDGSERSLLASWQSATVDGDLGRVQQDRKYLRLADVAQITALDVEDSRELLDRYLQRGICLRGLVLRCALCAGTGFYPIEDVGPGFRCRRCRQDNELTRRSWKSSEEPEWFYGLDEVVVQGLRHNAHVPILALAKLSKGSRSPLHMPEAVVHRPGHDDMEVDLWAIVDGRIVIGEAKKTDRLEVSSANEVARCEALRELMSDVTADEFVMATAASAWSSRSQGNVRRTIGSIAAVTEITSLH